VLIDNQVHNGQAGYRVLTPLALEGSRELLLVDRGWASGGGDRGAVPNPPPPGGIQMVHGTLDLPPRMALRLGASVVARAGWPLLLLDFDATEVSRQLGQPVLEMALKLSPNETGALVMQGYLGARSGPEKHLSYAVQWFALAAAVAVVFFAVSLERRYDNR
jgi:surfeit locus 1 family protein